MGALLCEQGSQECLKKLTLERASMKTELNEQQSPKESKEEETTEKDQLQIVSFEPHQADTSALFVELLTPSLPYFYHYHW